MRSSTARSTAGEGGPQVGCVRLIGLRHPRREAPDGSPGTPGCWAFSDEHGTRDGVHLRSPPASAGGFYLSDTLTQSVASSTTRSPGRKSSAGAGFASMGDTLGAVCLDRPATGVTPRRWGVWEADRARFPGLLARQKSRLEPRPRVVYKTLRGFASVRPLAARRRGAQASSTRLFFRDETRGHLPHLQPHLHLFRSDHSVVRVRRGRRRTARPLSRHRPGHRRPHLSPRRAG